MARPTKQQIAEARKQGIVEGAMIESPAVSNLFGTVSSPSQWIVYRDGSIANGCGKISLRSGDKWATVIAAPSKPTQPRIKGRFAAKPKEQPDRIKQIELDVNRHVVALITALDRLDKLLFKTAQMIADQGREFKSKLSAIESSVAERLDALRMEQSALAQDASKSAQDAPIGLQPGDYCDASQEVADALKGMGLRIWADGSSKLYYVWDEQDKDIVPLNSRYTSGTHLDHPTFLSRARVTAKELGLKPVEAPQVDELQPGDWCYASMDLRDLIQDSGLWRYDNVSAKEFGVHRFNRDGSIDANIEHPFASLDEIPAEEFRRRLLGTIAKRKEAERAEKVAALKFGVRVMTPDGEGIFHERSAGVGHWVIFPNGQRNFTLDEINIL